ncbi:MAG TPA: aldehyde dehydrogenase family protein [Microthrixaceae bacterium]|jgi:acyl-CoA reductase-like NAD-dependent aldehyde dehydrogenase|nr:aldehyde dehydrogenase family protein [Microthrixaceae bacterium]HQF94553.1 aldehyde dehydrogenase family protein [Microthrixaceae bacterium]
MATPVLTPALIDGTDVTDGEVTEVRSPFDGRVVGLVPSLTTDHVDRAVAVALERHRGPQLPAHQRAEILERAAVLLTERNEEFGQSISAESAKPITTARIEASRAVDTLRFSAVQARTLVGEMVAMDATPAGVGKLGYVKRVPIGVIGAISPFNFPLNLVCHKIAPALAAGCPVVLKPASATPLTALKIARLFEEAGLPPGWLNVVTCPGSVADRLVTHDDVAMITFTGSPEVGWGIRARGARKRVSLELGNNAPVVVEADADLELAATKIVAGGFAFSGQTCISVQRVYVHSSVHDELLDLVTAKVEQLVVGDPADDATVVSALIASKETKRVKDWIDEAVAAGARLVVGGDLTPDEVLKPTVLDNVTADMKVCSDEVFGPMIGVASYDDYEDALARANDTRYGLQAAVFTKDLAKALRAADVLDFGGVLINEMPSWRADQQPYGGVRDSGNTREGPAYTVQEMTERRVIIITG